jgi:PAS domain S-box-containing protein
MDQFLKEFNESDELSRNFFDNMFTSYAHCSMVYQNGKPVDYIYKAVNTAFYKMTRLEDVVGNPVSEVIPGYPNNNPESLERFDFVVRTGKPVQFEHYLESLDKYYSFYVFKAGPDEFIVLSEDLTDLKRKEAALKESEQKFSTVFRRSPLGITILALDTGMFIDVNDAALDLTGFSREEFLSRSSLEISLIADPDYQTDLVAQLHNTGSYQNIEMRIRRKNGNFGYVLVNGQTVSVSGRDCLMSFMTDITERKKMEEEIRKLNLNLEEKVNHGIKEIRHKDHIIITQSRQAAMGEMLSNIAHQWRQPLNALALVIQNFCNKALGGKLDPEYIWNRQNMMLDMIQHMSQTINDFRDFFKPDKIPEKFRISESVGRIKDIILPTLENSGIGMEVRYSQDATVEGFPNEYGQVVINLINNAREAIMEKKIEKPFIRIFHQIDNDCSILTVRDNAGGIDEDIIDRIFDPYFTTKEMGTGLGLYMSKAIIEKNMGGKLTVRNIAEGAEFRIELQLNIPQDTEIHVS